MLLIVFFALATLAILNTLHFISANMTGTTFTNAAARIWLITLGFMFITGAFGLWAIQFSSEVESLRRIGRLIDSMDYLSDGLLVLDKKGLVTGSNPAIRNMLHTRLGYKKHLWEIFSCLSQDDVALLLDSKTPQEIERVLAENGASQILRFRSQPSEGITLILVSDVTVMNAQHIHRRQIAQLQLIGHIARGVAHDFNNLLCVISGHASLLKRLPPDSPEIKQSIETIISNTQRGSTLAGHLLELAQQSVSGQPTNMSHEYVRSAIQLLHDSIAPTWQIISDIQTMPTVPLTGIQIEQVVLNLALTAADILDQPGILTISTGKPGHKDLLDIDKKFAALITISVEPSEPNLNIAIHNAKVESGVILSVIRSVLEEAGCTLKYLAEKNNKYTFRIALPIGNITNETHDSSELSHELETYVSNWTVLLARPNKQKTVLDERLAGIGVKVVNVNDITSTLAYIEEAKELDAIIIDQLLLNREMRGLLRAILKLRPSAGIVLFGENPSSLPEELVTSVVYAPITASPDKTILAMIEAKNQSFRRRKNTSA